MSFNGRLYRVFDIAGVEHVITAHHYDFVGDGLAFFNGCGDKIGFVDNWLEIIPSLEVYHVKNSEESSQSMLAHSM